MTGSSKPGNSDTVDRPEDVVDWTSSLWEVINVASDAGKTATPGEAVIGAAKAAIVMFTRTLAIEAKRSGIRVNVLTPSLVNGTASTERITSAGFSAKLFAKAATQAHLGVPESEDIAALAVFLASPAARRLTAKQQASMVESPQPETPFTTGQ